MTMQDSKRRPRIKFPTILACGLCLLLFIGFTISTATISVSGSATLPNGLVADIDGEFFASEGEDITTVQASGRTFVFTNAEITVDGNKIADLDESAIDVAIDARRNDVRFSLNGHDIPLPGKTL